MNFLSLQFLILKTFPCFNKQLLNELPQLTISKTKDISLLQWTFSNYSTLAKIKKFWRLPLFVLVLDTETYFFCNSAYRNCMMMMGTGWLDPIQFIYTDWLNVTQFPELLPLFPSWSLHSHLYRVACAVKSFAKISLCFPVSRFYRFSVLLYDIIISMSWLFL